MSIAQFDEIYEICCDMEEEEEILVNVKPPIERLDLMKDCVLDTNRWWKTNARRILNEKETELFYV